MKATRTLLGSFILACFLFISCQKEVTENIIETPQPETSDSIYLDKIYEMYDDGSGLDTQNIAVVRYDNLKRVTAIADSINTGSAANWYYFYNGTDTLPYKSIYTYGDALDTDSQVVFHYYDANQRKLKDSIIDITSVGNGLQISVFDYSYAPGKMYGQSYKIGINPASPIVYSSDTATLDTKGNITNNRNSTLIGSNYVLNRTSDFTYDNFIHPISKLNIWKSYNRFPNGETLFWEMMCTNNILTQNEVTLPPNAYTFAPTYTYTYNQHGLAVTNTTGSGPDIDIEIFTYKSL